MLATLPELSVYILLVMVGIAAVTDLRSGLIPNSLPAVGAVAAVMVQLLAAASGQTPWWSAAQQLGLGLLAGSLVPLVLYAVGGLGGGDVKLFAAIGLCVGPSAAIAIQFWSHLFALAYAPFVVLRAGSLRACLCTSASLLLNLVLPRQRRRAIVRTRLTALRFAPAILVASLWVCVLGRGLP